MKRLLLVIMVISITAVGSLSPASAQAFTDPGCGDIRYKGKTLWLSAGGVSCARARALMRRYMDRGVTPKGYRCSKAYGTPDCWHRTQKNTFIMTTTPH